MNLHKKLFCSMGAVLLLSSTNLLAADDSAREILNKAYKTIGSMDKYAFTADITNVALQDKGDGGTYRHTSVVKVDRPGKLVVETTGIVTNRTNYLNEGTFTMFDQKSNYYGQVKTKKSIDASLDMLFEKIGIRAPLSQLIYSDMNKRVKFQSGKYFGTKEIGGVECDYVAFKNGSKEIHVWIATGDTPLVKSYSIIDQSTTPTSRINVIVTWNTHANISDSDFVFVAPKGASKITVNKAK